MCMLVHTGHVIVNKMVPEDVAGEMTFEKRLDGGEVGPMYPHERECSSHSRCKGHGVGVHLECSRTSRESTMAKGE